MHKPSMRVSCFSVFASLLLLCASLMPAHAQLSGAVTDKLRAAMQDCGSGLPCLNATMVASAVPLTTTQSLNQLFLGAFQSCGGVPCLTITNAAGSGMVTTSGAPVAGQAAEFTSATAITGVATTGTGSYVKNTSPSLLGTTTATRLSFTGAPVYDLGFGILAVSVPIPLDTADHTIPASDAFDHVRISQTTGANNTFTVGANATVTGYRALLTLNSGSDSTAAMYGAAFGITNAGPGSAKAVHGAVSASGASTGVLVAFNAQIVPVATTNALSSAVQVSLTSAVGAHDVVTGMNIGSSGDRFLYGIGSPGGAVPYGKAAFHAWMATGSSAGADFLRLDNNAGTTIYHVDKSGNEFAQQISLRDTSAAFDVTLAAVSSVALTAGRTLTLDMGNVAHVLTLGTTASTGSGIIFPNTATDTIAMLGIANQFAPVITANNFAMLLAGSVDRSGSTTAQAVSALKMTTALTAEQNGSAPGRSVYGHYLNFGTMTAISGAANNIFADLAISPAVLSKPGGATIATRAALYIDAAPSGGITNYAIYASGTVAVVGTLTATAIASNAAAQTGYLCYNSAAPGTITYDGGATCLVSLEEFKDRVGPITGALALVDQLQPFWGSYKHGTPMSDHHIQPFLGAHQVESVDPRLVTYTDSGELHGVRYQNLSAVLVASIQEEHHLTTDLMRDLQALKDRVRHLER